MKQSRLFVETMRETPGDTEALSHQWLVKAGYLRQLTAGVYSFLPLGQRVLAKIESLVRHEMNQAGAQEVMLPIMQPADLWQQTGRIDNYGEELIRFEDRHGRMTVLGPTHEEVITSLVRQVVRSYRQLPVTLYQIQTKFRDERRPRAGLLRGREFRMKDAYSFDLDEDGLNASYQSMYDAYCRIFTSLGLRFAAVEADPGAIGGEGGTHEFIVLSDAGEDTFATCPSCGYSANVEIMANPHIAADPVQADVGAAACVKCGARLAFQKGIEVGHIFKLGTVYSNTLQAMYVDGSGVNRPFVMGCYGIGTSRLMAATVEQCHDARGIVWPMRVAPFRVHIVPVNMGQDVQRNMAVTLYESLSQSGIDVLLDDRDERAGVKFADADMMGIPIQVIVGNRASEGVVDVKMRQSGEVLTMSAHQVGEYVAKFRKSS